MALYPGFPCPGYKVRAPLGSFHPFSLAIPLLFGPFRQFARLYPGDPFRFQLLSTVGDPFQGFLCFPNRIRRFTSQDFLLHGAQVPGAYPWPLDSGQAATLWRKITAMVPAAGNRLGRCDTAIGKVEK